MSSSLRNGPRYVGYAYGYPHKTAYQAFSPPRALSSLWRDEPRDALFLYVHVPFCEMRCGFCNLFARPVPDDDRVEQYLHALARQTQHVRDALGDCSFARFAMGGGTPTWLSAHQLDRVLTSMRTVMSASLDAIPSSVETSPATATADRLAVLHAHGVDRVSMGVQSFVPAELSRLGRPQPEGLAEQALERVRTLDFRTLNLDLIYGLPDQTERDLERSVRTALSFAPEEVFLYPLYVRPRTGLWSRARRLPQADAPSRAPDDRVAQLYDFARDLLVSSGYSQHGMRMFRSARARSESGPAYCVQRDGMVGLGCGARSYTRSVHWSEPFAVGSSGVDAVIDQFIARDAFSHALHGIELSRDEQQRRHVLLTLLADGLDLADYTHRFGTHALDDHPTLRALLSQSLATHTHNTLALTPDGVARADAIGPALYSPEVQSRMDASALA